MSQPPLPTQPSLTEFRNYWSATKAQLDQEVVRQLPKFLGDLPAAQIEAIHQILDGGKRIRGCLVCLVNNALGGKIEDAIPRVVAIECIHAASLIHDDYVDNDSVRRKRPAMWTVKGPRKAVLLGDIIFATTVQKMIEMSRGDGLVITQAIATMANGAYQEISDPLSLSSAVTEEPYRRELYNLILYLKTGVLFGAASQLGALSAGASAATSALAFEFGARVGEAYQIADDLQEVLAFDAHAPDLSEKVSLLAPVILHFSGETNAQLVRLIRGPAADLQKWFDKTRPVLMSQMEHEIKLCLDRAMKETRDFPDNCYTRMLRTAPAEMVQMMNNTIPI